MVKVITNNLGNGDWVIVESDTERVFAGHEIRPLDFYDILVSLGVKVKLIEVTDEEMEEDWS